MTYTYFYAAETADQTTSGIVRLPTPLTTDADFDELVRLASVKLEADTMFVHISALNPL